MGKGCAGAGRVGSTLGLPADLAAIRYCQEVKDRVLISLYFRHSHSTGPAKDKINGTSGEKKTNFLPI